MDLKKINCNERRERLVAAPSLCSSNGTASDGRGGSCCILSTNSAAPRQEISHSLRKPICILGTGKELQRVRRRVWRGPVAAMAETA